MDVKNWAEEIEIALFKAIPLLFLGAIGVTTRLLVYQEKLSWRRITASYIVGCGASYVAGDALVYFGYGKVLPVACYIVGLTAHRIVQYLLSKRIVENVIENSLPQIAVKRRKEKEKSGN
jgi:hypothetical protein